MDVFTVQLGQWRKAVDHGILIINTTMKSGDPLFAPSKDIVYGSKYYGMSPEEYTQRYIQEMNNSYRNNPVRWEEFMLYHADKRVALACYCRPGKFCHRHILVKMLDKVCRHYTIPFQYFGELC